jgi:hypothetical protein
MLAVPPCLYTPFSSNSSTTRAVSSIWVKPPDNPPPLIPLLRLHHQTVLFSASAVAAAVWSVVDEEEEGYSGMVPARSFVPSVAGVEAEWADWCTLLMSVEAVAGSRTVASEAVFSRSELFVVSLDGACLVSLTSPTLSRAFCVLQSTAVAQSELRHSPFPPLPLSPFLPYNRLTDTSISSHHCSHPLSIPPRLVRLPAPLRLLRPPTPSTLTGYPQDLHR